MPKHISISLISLFCDSSFYFYEYLLYIQRVLQKKYIQFKMFIFEKEWNKLKNILLCSFRGILTKYLGTLFNYKLIINYCEFLMAFINRTRVLVGIVMFKAHWRNNKTFSHNNGKLLLLLSDTHREKQGFTQFSTGMAGWLLLTFFICLHNELSSIHSTITY